MTNLDSRVSAGGDSEVVLDVAVEDKILVTL